MIHTAPVKARALELHKIGLHPAAIARILASEGTLVPSRTVRYWCNPEAQERDRERQRRRWAKRAQRKRDERAAALLPRARRLHEAGVSCRCIAVLFRIDHGQHLTEEQVRRAIASGVWPRPGVYRQVCEGCGGEFSTNRPGARWCSSRCRNRPELHREAA